MTTTQQFLENTARMFRIGRKVTGVTQKHIADALGVVQGTISKYESGILQPSALDWYNFCNYVNVDSYKSLKEGYIDNCSRIQEMFYQGMSFSMHKRYKTQQMLKVREILPIVAQAIKEVGEANWLAYLKKVHMDPDYFYVYDAPLSLLFVQDLLSSGLIKSRTGKFLENAARLAGDLNIHGDLKTVYQGEDDSLSIMRAYMKKSKLYEDLFDYQQSMDGRSFRLVITPKIASTNKEEKKFVDLYLNYKIDYLKFFVTKNSRQTGLVHVINEPDRRGIEVRQSA